MLKKRIAFFKKVKQIWYLLKLKLPDHTKSKIKLYQVIKKNIQKQNGHSNSTKFCSEIVITYIDPSDFDAAILILHTCSCHHEILSCLFVPPFRQFALPIILPTCFRFCTEWKYYWTCLQKCFILRNFLLLFFKYFMRRHSYRTWQSLENLSKKEREEG